MPYSPKSSCKISGCPNKSYKQGYCQEHHKKLTAQYDERRGTATERGYNDRWNKSRKSWMSDVDHPERALCTICLREGKYNRAEAVDHIVPHKGNYEIFWDEDNWQSLCAMHHNRKTMREREQY